MEIKTSRVGKELNFQEKEVLSWKLISEIILLVDSPVGIAVLHPGGGQYDTLSLVTRNAEVILGLNRNGSSALINNHSVGDIWKIANDDLEVAISKIVEVGKLNPAASPLGKNLSISNFAREIAMHLEKYADSGATAEWGWVDSSYGSGPNHEVLEKFSIPLMWKSIEPMIPGTGWQSNIFVLTNDSKPHSAEHMVLSSWKLSPKKRI